ncbi:cupredoxin domain-containing protein [Actinopolymorpha sp. B17G11]|uniref:cupredoxin domain-containing protein n=1 Tax=unclassified Actinopolymorpha TaxID=2627063 RepID=UPI0032D94EA4
MGLIVVLISVLSLTGCGGDPEPARSGAATPKPAKATPTLQIGSKAELAGVRANYHGTKDITGARKVSIEIEDNYFSPTVIKGTPGQRIVVSLENESQSPHTFTIAGTYVDMQIQPGGVSEVPVRLPKSGNLSFFCTFQKKNGMAGVFNASGPIDKPGPKATARR